MKNVELTCEGCGKKQKFPASSPAAPVLTASEASVKVGWSFQLGFHAMLTGDHHNRCPDCKGQDLPSTNQQATPQAGKENQCFTKPRQYMAGTCS